MPAGGTPSEPWLSRAVDVRELSRTVRRRSHFPTVTALHNSVQKLLELSRETEGQMDYLVQELEAIRAMLAANKCNAFRDRRKQATALLEPLTISSKAGELRDGSCLGVGFHRAGPETSNPSDGV